MTQVTGESRDIVGRIVIGESRDSWQDRHMTQLAGSSHNTGGRMRFDLSLLYALPVDGELCSLTN